MSPFSVSLLPMLNDLQAFMWKEIQVNLFLIQKSFDNVTSEINSNFFKEKKISLDRSGGTNVKNERI